MEFYLLKIIAFFTIVIFEYLINCGRGPVLLCCVPVSSVMKRPRWFRVHSLEDFSTRYQRRSSVARLRKQCAVSRRISCECTVLFLCVLSADFATTVLTFPYTVHLCLYYVVCTLLQSNVLLAVDQRLL
jgi:hypothetical protein